MVSPAQSFHCSAHARPSDVGSSTGVLLRDLGLRSLAADGRGAGGPGASMLEAATHVDSRVLLRGSVRVVA